MRVAIITNNYYPFIGGAEVFAQEVAEYLSRTGCEVDVITVMPPDSNLSSLAHVNGVRVHRIKIGKVRYLSFLVEYIKLMRCFLRLDKRKRYDLIHAVDGVLPFILATSIKKLKNRPIILTIQGGELLTGFKSVFSGEVIKKLYKWSFRNADLVHVISQTLAQKAKEFGVKNIVIIPNGVDSKLFKPRNNIEKLRESHGFSPDEKIIVCVARLTPVKGVDCLIKAVSLVAENIPNIRLIVIGDGEQRKELEKLIDELNLNNNVQLLGSIPHEQIPEYLNMADVFVLPSRHEGLGIALIEAMACGIPIIGSSVDGIVDIIDHERNGILFPPGDTKALGIAIKRILQDEELRNCFTEEGLKRVEKCFLWSSILQRIGDIYEKLVQDKNKRNLKYSRL